MRFTLALPPVVVAAVVLAALAGGTSTAQAANVAQTAPRRPLPPLAFGTAPRWDSVKITAYTVPTARVDPFDIALGPAGDLYFTQPILNQGAGNSTYLWRVTASGRFSRVLPALGMVGALGITRGAGGTVYFGLERNGGTDIGSYAGGAKIQFSTIPGLLVNAVYFLAQAPDGSLWFSDPGDYKVGHIVGTHYTLYQAPTMYCSPYGITIGSDHNVWVAEQCPTAGTGKIGRITAAGGWTEYTVPTQNEQPFGITAGPDGNLWYTGDSSNDIGRVTPGGIITEFSLSSIGMHFGSPYLITVGNDGALWFTVQTANMVGRITTSGAATEYPIPGCGSQCSVVPGGIAAGVGRTIWFTNWLGNQVDKLAY
jgi:virginiamycin B lyase